MACPRRYYFGQLIVQVECCHSVPHFDSRAVGHIDRALGKLGLGWAALVCFVLGTVILWPLTDVPFINFQF